MMQHQKFNCRIITWQPTLTVHQSTTFSALGLLIGDNIQAHTLAEHDPKRIGHIWPSPEVGNVSVMQHGAWSSVLTMPLELLKSRKDIHIFCSPWQDVRIIICIVLSVLFSIKFFIISEPYGITEDPYFGPRPTIASRMRRRLRPLVYRIYCALIRNKLLGIFAISDLARRQYSGFGISERAIFPFGYFISTPIPDSKRLVNNNLSCSNGVPLRAAFVGAISTRKGVDILVEAARLLYKEKSTVSFDFYGDGDVDLMKNLTPNCRYFGPIEFGAAFDIMNQYDFLIVPSRHDGWGVVVNEAIASGTPVICSDGVGSSRIISETGSGLVYAPNLPECLADIVSEIDKDRERLNIMRGMTATAYARFTPEAGARIMFEVIESKVQSL